MDTLLDWHGASFRIGRPALPAAAAVGTANLYVLGYSSGTVKIGLTRNPGDRISAHVGESSRHGVEVVRVWISGAHAEFGTNEGALKTWCAERCSTQYGAEYFGGIDPDDAIAFALTLPTSGDSEQGWARIPFGVNGAVNFVEQVRLGRYVVLTGEDYAELVALATTESQPSHRPPRNPEHGRRSVADRRLGRIPLTVFPGPGRDLLGA